MRDNINRIKKRRARAYSKRGRYPTHRTLGRYTNGIFATCKRGSFVLKRAIKPAKELIAQNPPQDGLQTRATSGLDFCHVQTRRLRAPERDQTGQGTDCSEPSPGWSPNPIDLGPGFRKASSGSRCSRRRQQAAASRQRQQAGTRHGRSCMQQIDRTQ